MGSQIFTTYKIFFYLMQKPIMYGIFLICHYGLAFKEFPKGNVGKKHFFKKSQKSLCWIRQPFFFFGCQVAKIRQKNNIFKPLCI
jgi:hypothetical protein